MDDMLKRIIDEKQLINYLKTNGIEGYTVEKIYGGYLYRFLCKDGTYHEIVNLSKAGQKTLNVKWEE